MARSKVGKAMSQQWASLEAPRVARQQHKDGLITRRKRDLKTLDARKAGEREYHRDHVGRFAGSDGAKKPHSEVRRQEIDLRKQERAMTKAERGPAGTMPPKHFKSDANARFKKINLDRAATKVGRGMFNWANGRKRKAAAQP